MNKLRLPSFLGLSISLVGLVTILAWVGLRFSMPRPVLVAVGREEDFQAGRVPGFFSQDGKPFYVLRLDRELIALSARSERITRCIIRWQAASNAFVDPCLGTHFAISGAYRGKGPPQEMQRLPLVVRDGQVWVEIGYR
jgi:hypothetical protein